MTENLNAKASVAAAFSGMLVQFVEAAIVAWPRDALLPVALTALQAQRPDATVGSFLARFGSVKDQLAKHDVSVLGDVSKDPLLQPLDVMAKYEGADDATRDSMWAYVDHLCRFATAYSMYAAIPTGLLGVISETANDLKNKLDSGDVDMGAINPFALGQQVMAKVRPEDLQEMMNTLTKDQDSMMNLITQMQALLPAGAVDASGMGALGGLGALFGSK